MFVRKSKRARNKSFSCFMEGREFENVPAEVMKYLHDSSIMRLFFIFSPCHVITFALNMKYNSLLKDEQGS